MISSQENGTKQFRRRSLRRRHFFALDSLIRSILSSAWDLCGMMRVM